MPPRRSWPVHRVALCAVQGQILKLIIPNNKIL